MKIKFAALALLSGLALSACTTSEVVTIQQPGDRNMTCAQLAEEFRDIENVVDDAQGDKGVNSANVAAVLLFWPAAVGNYVGAERALEAAEDRQAWLYDLYEEKSCDGEIG